MIALSVSSIAYIYASDSTVHIKFSNSFYFNDFTAYSAFDNQNVTYAYSSTSQIQNNIITLVKSINIAISKNESFDFGTLQLIELLDKMNVATILDTKSYYLLQFKLNKYTYQIANQEIVFKLPRGLKIAYISLTLLSDRTETIQNLSMGHTLTFYFLCNIDLDYYSNYFTINSLEFNNTLHMQYVQILGNYINQTNTTTFLNNTYFVSEVNELGNIYPLNVSHYQMLNLGDLLLPEYKI